MSPKLLPGVTEAHAEIALRLLRNEGVLRLVGTELYEATR